MVTGNSQTKASETVAQHDIQTQAMQKLRYLFQSHVYYLEEHISQGKIDTPASEEVSGFSLMSSQIFDELESSIEKLEKLNK